MGYRPSKKTYVLEFEDPSMNGLEVRTRSASLGELVRVGEIAQTDSDNVPVDEVTEIFRIFEKALIDWNIEDDDGNKVPVTLDGLYSLERDFVMEMIAGWQRVIGRTPDPLEKPSKTGETPNHLESIPMEALPSNQPH